MYKELLTNEKYKKLQDELIKDRDFLNVESEREFFINAHLLFEDLLNKVILKNDIESGYSNRLKALRNAFNDLPCIEYLYEFLTKLNNYRNEVAHNKYPKIEIDEIKVEIVYSIQSLFRCAFSLYESEKLTDELVKNKILNIKIPAKGFNHFENYVDEGVEKAKKTDENILIKPYDEYLYHAILLIHSIIANGLIGYAIGFEHYHKSK